MITKIEKLLDRFFVTSVTILSSAAFIAIPAFLFYLIMKESLNKGTDLLLAAGALSVFVATYFGAVHIKTRQFSNERDLAAPKVLYHAVRVGSLLLYICAGLVFIQVSLYLLGKLFPLS